MSQNPEVQMTLDEAVAEILGGLTGLDLTYDPELDRYRAVTRQLNRALRATALDNEWSYYASTLALGVVIPGERELMLPMNQRPRIVNDDAVRLVDTSVGRTIKWAYFLPRDALHKYEDRSGLWCSVTRRSVQFSRAFWPSEKGLEVQIPVMREPRMFRLPEQGEEVPENIRNQPVDFAYPDLTIARAAYFYAQADPVMQPRVQTLEQEYKTLQYALIERDTQITDTPYQNEFRLGIQNGLMGDAYAHLHPHSDTI
jgi:hypothetical protein